jgi:signal transduction histidine kinase/DNA-binding response OmpR family regulator
MLEYTRVNGMKLKNYKMNTVLVFAFSIFLGLTILMIAVSLLQIRTIQSSLRDIANVNNVEQEYLMQMKTSVLEREIALRNLALLYEETQMQSELQRIEKSALEYAGTEARLQRMFAELPQTTQIELDGMVKIKAAETATLPVMAKVQALGHANKAQDATKVIVDEMAPKLSHWLQELNALISFEDKLNEVAVQEAEDSYKSILTFMSMSAVLVLLLGGLIGWKILQYIQTIIGGEPMHAAAIVKQIADGDLSARNELKNVQEGSLLSFVRLAGENLEVLAKQAEQIGSGEYAIDVMVQSERDRLGNALKSMLDLLRQAQVAETQRKEVDRLNNWVKDGRTVLSSALTGEYEQLELADIAISMLGRYLQVGRGVVFLWRSAEQRLELVASYMYTERQHLSSHFALGEGAVGQVAKELKPIFLSTITPETSSITTGTTHAPALFTYTLPLIREQQLIGVLELARAERFDEIQLEFLNSACEIISSFLFVGEQQANIRALLNASEKSEAAARQQSENLQNLNTQMEEQQQQLQQQSEELQQSNAQMEEQQQQLQQQSEELRMSNTQLQEQRNLLTQNNADLLRTQNEALEKARQLEQAGHYKTEFLSNMSHELRTPLNAIILLSKMMASNVEARLCSADVKRSEVIHRSAKDLLGLINDVLDLSKIEAGYMDTYLTMVSSAALGQEQMDLFASLANEHALEFTVEDQINDAFLSDYTKLSQILRNLLANAFKFTKQGSVRLIMKHLPERELPLCFEVKDTGIGIPFEQQELIFQAFRQADGSTSREYGGTGLGLTISLRLAQLLGGTIELSSTPNVGSCFSLFLPESVADEVQQSTRPTERVESSRVNAITPLTPLRSFESAKDVLSDDRGQLQSGDMVILVIDDDPLFANILLDMNRGSGYKTLIATTGAQGIALAQQFHPSAILLDLGLPDCDGVDLLAVIKSHAELATTPVYIISARDRDDSLIEHGALAYLQKPLDGEQLCAILQQLANSIHDNNPLEKIAKQEISILLLGHGGLDQATLLDVLENDDQHDHVTIVECHDAEELAKLLQVTETKWTLSIIDLNNRSTADGIALAQQLRVVNANQSMLFYSEKVLDPSEEIQLRSYSDTIILKSLNSDQRLYDDISRFLQHVGKPALVNHSTLMPVQKGVLLGLKILVVDDDLRNLFVLTEALETNGATVVVAVNGLLAINLLENEPVDLVFMDMMMPEMDGYEAITAIRAHATLHSMPIVALTAKAMPQDRSKILEVGANDYLSKPVAYEELIRVALQWTRLADT